MLPLEIDWQNLHQILRDLYSEMMPLCGRMAGVARGLAGFGALFYIAYRVWKSLAAAEPIDVFPLLRPFVIGLCIMFFPSVVMGTMNGILSPVANGTSAILDSQTFDMQKYQQQKDKLEYEAMLRDPSKAYLVSDEEFDKRIEELGWTDTFTIMGMYIERLWYNIGQKVRDFFRMVLELLFQAASLTVDTIRTFFLVVLTILGPISFALSIYDGFQSTLTQWLARYISIYMWLPVSDLFGAILAKIQILMLQQDIALLEDPAYIPDGSNTVYCIFLIIGILGYFCVPTVASWIVQTAGAGNYTSRVNSVVMMAGGTAATLGGLALGKTIGGGKKLAKAGYGKYKKWRQKRKSNKRKREQPEQPQT